ncbi:flagellin [Paracoccus sp. WLY502]|uniref:flagellin n=1 Tax=Paracoccus yibinensis TaxID=3068891 RepID=UPI00279667D5|nr:flagellin [Paracoccus sp. WLY502]MDQ1901809.1 flagellin [Paracoccus sp. WLY502]
MSSILTNNGAIVALQTLKNVNGNLNKAQSEIATGLRVATAKDNSSAWAIASTMNSDIQSMKTLSNSLTSAGAMVSTARDAAEQISEKLKEIQTKIVQAENPDADTAKLQAEVTALTDTIVSIATSAQYNGINLTSAAATDQNVTVSIQRDDAGALTAEELTVTAFDLEALGAALTVGTATLDDIDTLLDTANEAAASFGAAQARIEAQAGFLNKQADSLKMGVSALVDADMEEASARLQALQTQQQLGIQALSIANQAPSAVLSLFR